MNYLPQPAKTEVNHVDIDRQTCLVCGACVGVCPANAMTLENDLLFISEDLCTHCARCVQICPVRALRQGVDAR